MIGDCRSYFFSGWLEPVDDGLGKLCCLGRSAQIEGDVLSSGDDRVASLLDASTQLDFAKIAQHHTRA